MKRRPTAHQWIGWGFVAAVVFSFVAALLVVGVRSPQFVALTTMLFSFLPFFVFPVRACFAGRSILRCVGIGWGTFFLGQLIFFLLYSALYPKYQHVGWVAPEGNGVVAAAVVGAVPGFIITLVADLVRRFTTRVP